MEHEKEPAKRWYAALVALILSIFLFLPGITYIQAGKAFQGTENHLAKVMTVTTVILAAFYYGANRIIDAFGQTGLHSINSLLTSTAFTSMLLLPALLSCALLPLYYGWIPRVFSMLAISAFLYRSGLREPHRQHKSETPLKFLIFTTENLLHWLVEYFLVNFTLKTPLINVSSWSWNTYVCVCVHISNTYRLHWFCMM